jgi:hypothetical protein
MNKYIGTSLVALGLLFSVGFLAPAPAQASSLTSTQVSAILSLLQSFGADQGTISNVSAALGGSAPANTSCLNLSNNLTLGSSGSDVTSLQNYLIQKGDLTGTSATGYYGYLTVGAVGQLQLSLNIVSSSNDSAYGIMGPKTRAAVGCGSTSNGSTVVMPTSTPVPTITSSSLQTYSNSQYGFSFQYPSDFSVVATPISNRAKVTATGQQLWGSTYPAPQVLVEATVDPSTVLTCNSQNLGSLVTLGSLSLILAGVNITPTLGTQTIGGVQFRSASMAADIKGVFASFTIYAALNNGVCYIVAAGLTGPDPATQNQSQSASPVVLPTVAATIAAEENAILQSFNFSTPTVSAQLNTSSVTASIDSNSLTQNTGTFSLTGSAVNSSNVTMFLSAYNYGSVSYNTMQGQIGKDGVYQYSAAVSGGRWSAAVTQALSSGTYYVQVYDTASQTLLTTGTLTVNGQTSTSNTTTTQQSSYPYVAPNLFITPSIGSAPLAVTVYPNATPYAYSNGYSIDYGDGSVVQCGQICQPNTHTYSAAGVYTAKLEGLAGGTSVLATATVTVSAPSSATSVTTPTAIEQISASIDPSSPSLGTVVSGNTGVNIGLEDLQAINGPVAVSQLTLSLNSGSTADVSNVYVYNGSAFLGTAQFSSNNTAVVSLASPLIVSPGTPVKLLIKVDIGNSATSGDFVQVNVSNVQGKGVNSGLPVSASAVGVVAGVRIAGSGASGAVTINSINNPYPNTPFTLSGTLPTSVSGVSVAVVGSNPTPTTVALAYTGSTDWNTVSHLLNAGSGYTGVIGGATAQGNTWSVSIKGLPEGWYAIMVYDLTNKLVATSTVYVTAKG